MIRLLVMGAIIALAYGSPVWLLDNEVLPALQDVRQYYESAVDVGRVDERR